MCGSSERRRVAHTSNPTRADYDDARGASARARRAAAQDVEQSLAIDELAVSQRHDELPRADDVERDEGARRERV